ncbi:MAG TPA: DUF6325 family protein [Solirubrobacteraceae bacterium]|jgi:uncharacterized membrane protein
MQIGPVQLLVVGFPTDKPHPQLRAEVERLRSQPGIRLLDMMVVRKHEDGGIERLETSDLSDSEATELGAMVGALIGAGAGGAEGAELGAEAGALAAAEGKSLAQDFWFVEDTLPTGTAAAVALIEHQWAIGLRDGIRNAGGSLIAESWIHPLDLVAIGLVSAEEAEQELSF